MVIAENNWVYLISGMGPDNCSSVTTFDASGDDYTKQYYTPIGPQTAMNTTLSAVVSKDCSIVLVSDFFNGKVYVLSGASKENPKVQILHSIAIGSPGTAVVTHDNTRIFVATTAGINVLEPVFV